MKTAPRLPYQPPTPRGPAPGIGFIGCGGIAAWHLTAYRDAGWPVRVLCSRDASKASDRRDEFFPDAEIATDWREVVERDDIGIIDATPHPEQRAPIVEGALRSGKHVLSQKPFVNDLDLGARLCDLADAEGLKLAVNQNGRFAPHLSWMRCAANSGLVGAIQSIDVSIHWDHNWIAGTAFDDTPDLLLHDFGIHWVDFIQSLMGDRPVKTTASDVRRSASQRAKPPLQGEACVRYEGARATLTFNGDSPSFSRDTTIIVGSEGVLESTGPDLDNQKVTLHRGGESCSPALEGRWFPDGFRGAMGDLICAIEDDRTPLCDGRSNLASLSLCRRIIDGHPA